MPEIVINGATLDARHAVAKRLARLHGLADSDAESARDEAWAWLAELSRRVFRDRDSALAELGELFRAGVPSRGINDLTEGSLVSTTVHPLIDRMIAAVTSLWQPWIGKRFFQTDASGDNLLVPSCRLPAKLLWPRYRLGRLPFGLVGFEFVTRIEPGRFDPDRDVLVLDYGAVPANPWLLVRQFRDELVEIIPGAHLGKTLLRRGDEGGLMLGYFALRTRID